VSSPLCGVEAFAALVPMRGRSGGYAQPSVRVRYGTRCPADENQGTLKPRINGADPANVVWEQGATCSAELEITARLMKPAA